MMRDEEMLDCAEGGDERLPVDATTPFDASRVHAPVATVEQQLQRLTGKFADFGLDVSILDSSPNEWLPLRESADYSTNHRELLDVYGIKLSKRTQDTDILHRYRLAVKLVRPDKLGLNASQEVLAWARRILVALDLEKTELLQRVEWVRRRQIDAPTLEESFAFQEVNDVCQAWLLEHFHLVTPSWRRRASTFGTLVRCPATTLGSDASSRHRRPRIEQGQSWS